MNKDVSLIERQASKVTLSTTVVRSEASQRTSEFQRTPVPIKMQARLGAPGHRGLMERRGTGMSRGATMSIMGLYNNDPTVLDLMAFPEDFTDAQKQNVKENILIECAELEFLYPAPAVAKNIIGIWSRKEVPYWDRMYKASLLEYNPIENYRRNETETITDGKTEEHSGTDVNTASGSDALTKTGTDTNTESGSESLARTGTDTDTDSGTESFRKTGTDTDTDSGTESLRRSGTDTNTASGSDTTTGTSESTETNSGSDTVLNKITGFDSNTLVSHDESDTTYGHVIDNEASGSNTQSYGRVDTQQHNTTDTTTFGKVTETEHDTTDTTTFGKVTETEHDTTDTTTFGKIDTLLHNTVDTTTYGKMDSFRHGEKIEHEGSSSRSLLAYGNIGTMTSQDMLTQEAEVAKLIQVVPIIIESFKNRFCLMVY